MLPPLASAWSAAWQPPDRRPIYEWAADHISLPPAYAIHGEFGVERSRHLIGPFEAIADDEAHFVTMLKAVQTGGSLVADVSVPWFVVNNPGPLLWNFQSDQIADQHAEARAIPVIKGCPPVQPLLPADRHKIRTSELIFPHMPIYIQGPSLLKAQSKSIRILINDELWCWNPGRYADMLGRISFFEELDNHKVINISQAGLEDDELDEEWKRATMREWMVPCLECGKYMQPVWSGFRDDGSRWGMRWDSKAKDAHGEWILDRVIETIRYECQHCGHGHPVEIQARVKREWNRLGKYEATNPTPEPGRESFHWSSIITRSWAALVTQYIHALRARNHGNVEPLIEFMQKRLAEAGSESKAFSLESPPKAAYVVESEWPEEKYRFMTVDVQADGTFWVVVRAWAKSGESRRLWFGRLHGWPEIQAKQSEHKVQANQVLVDSGDQTRTVYYHCAENGWIALKGDARDAFAHPIKRNGRIVGHVRKSYSSLLHGDPEQGKREQGREFCKLILWSNPSIKNRLKRLRDGRGAKWLVPAVTGEAVTSEEEYNKQMSAEYRKQQVEPKTFRRKWIWVCPSGNNHLFDCEAMQVLAATLVGCLVDNVDEEPNPSPQVNTGAPAAS